MEQVEIFTDSACRRNPGLGGRKRYFVIDEMRKASMAVRAYTTNNRMELTVALKEACKVELTTDSEYVRQGISNWLVNWKKRGWKTAAKKPVKNADLWQKLDQEASLHEISWHWVKGHSGHRGNEIADQLANKGVNSL